MNKADFKIARPSFPDRQVKITDFGAVPYAYGVENSRKNADAINSAIFQIIRHKKKTPKSFK